MMGWLEALPAILVALTLLVGLGLPASFLLPVRGVARLGAAVVISLASIAGASLLAPIVGVPWSLLPVVAVALLITLLSLALRLTSRARVVADEPGIGAWGWASLGVAFTGWVVLLLVGISSPSNPSQLYDGVYHLNAVEFILDTGDASPLHMTMAVPGRASSFYPSLWHALVSLVVLQTAAPIVVATNAVTLSIVALVWPVSLTVLSRQLFPGAKVASAAAPLLGFGFAIYPLGFLNWGVLYPNLLGMALVPLLIAFILAATKQNLSPPDRISRSLLALAAAGAVALGHPSSLLGALILLMPWVGGVVGRLWSRQTSARVRIVIVIVAVLGALTAVMVWRAANVSTNEWMPGATLAHAVGEIAFLSPVGRSSGLLLGTLAVIGMVTLVREKRWWPVAAHLVAGFFFAMATWFTILPIRTFFVGVWYDDTTRVAALLAVFGVPLAAYGAQQVWTFLNDWKARRRTPRIAPIAVIVVLVAFGATHLLAIKNDLRMMRNISFVFNDQSQGLSPDEAEIFDAAAAIIGDDSVVIGDPLTGAALYYAYTGGDVVYFHIGGSYGEQAAFLAKHMSDGSPEVCAALDELGVDFAFDFGSRSMYPKADVRYAGLHDLETTPIFTEVVRSGDAVLYAVTGCDVSR